MYMCSVHSICSNNKKTLHIAYSTYLQFLQNLCRTVLLLEIYLLWFQVLHLGRGKIWTCKKYFHQKVLLSRKIQQVKFSSFETKSCTYQRFYNCLPTTPREEVFLSTPILLLSVQDKEQSKANGWEELSSMYVFFFFLIY